MKVGILTYYWPPAGGPGVQRWLKLSKYLAREGVELFVVTVDADKATYPLRDEGLAADVHPNIHVVRTGTNEKFGAYKKVVGTKKVPFSGFSGEDSKVSFKEKLARFVRGNFLIPDARKGWNAHAYAAAKMLVEAHGVRTWITTSPPHSTQLVGLKLKRDLGVHWVADFRDPWTDIYYYHKFYPTALARWYERGLERKVFATCDHLISVSPSWSALYAEKGAQPASKVVTVTNGFDLEDFAGVQYNRPEVFTLTYAGTLASQYPVQDLVEALNTVEYEMRLRVIGSWDAQSKMRLEQLGDHVEVEFVEYIPKAELNAEIMASHLMLFLLPPVESASGHIPGKLFDYLGAGNPILGLGPVRGDASAIIEKAQAGMVFSYSDHTGIADFVRGQVVSGAPRISAEHVHAYNREEQAKSLLHILDSKG